MSIKHVGIIMDGNGRYAKALNKTRSFGHYMGVKNIKNVVQYAIEEQINILSLFAFSTENWDRPKQEVKYLVSLFKKNISSPKLLNKLNKNGIKFVWKGFEDNISIDLINKIRELEKNTQHNNKLTLAIMFNYGGKKEIINAINLAVKNNEIVDENTINKYLLTGDLGPMDLLIRTGGKKRISNFMLYNFAYSEIYFCESYWPAFQKEDWKNALDFIKGSKRTFGKVIDG